MTPLERLTELFVVSGLEYDEFARAIGSSPRTLRRYYHEQRVPDLFAEYVARIVSVEADAETVVVVLRRGE